MACRRDFDKPVPTERGTGIRERRVGGTTAGLSIEAGRKAIERAGLRPEDIDALVLATTTPDRAVPATSSTVQHALGLTCGAYDLNAMPATVLIDKDGRVRQVHRGYREGVEQTYEQQVRDLLKE